MKPFLRYFFMVCVVCVCIVAVSMLHARIRELRISIAERIAYIEHAPAQQQRFMQSQEQLRAAQDKLKQISTIVVSQDDLSEVVKNISLAANSSGVTVQIPDVASDAQSSGAFEDVRIRMNAVGSPAALVSFLYRLEHLPYVIRLSSWNLDTTYQSQLQSFVGLVPPDAKAPKPATGSALAVEAVISLMKQ